MSTLEERLKNTVKITKKVVTKHKEDKSKDKNLKELEDLEKKIEKKD